MKEALDLAVIVLLYSASVSLFIISISTLWTARTLNTIAEKEAEDAAYYRNIHNKETNQDVL